MAAMRLATRISIVFRRVILSFVLYRTIVFALVSSTLRHHWPSSIEFRGKNPADASEEIPILPAERGLRRTGRRLRRLSTPVVVDVRSSPADHTEGAINSRRTHAEKLWRQSRLADVAVHPSRRGGDGKREEQ